MSCFKECLTQLSKEYISLMLLAIALLIIWLLGAICIDGFAFKFFLMFFSGIIGGIVNFWYSNMKNNVAPKELIPCVVIGIGASLLTPLVASWLSGDPFKNFIMLGNDYLKLISWCLLAGISGEPVISMAIKRFLRPLVVPEPEEPVVPEPEEPVVPEPEEPVVPEPEEFVVPEPEEPVELESDQQDLQIKEISVLPEKPKKGEILTISAEVSGGKAPYTYTISFSSENAELSAIKELSAITKSSPSTTIEEQVTVPNTVVKDTTILVKIEVEDSEGKLTENNTKNFTVVE
jgi:hypothetical protein